MAEKPVRCQFKHWGFVGYHATFKEQHANRVYGYAEAPTGRFDQCWMTKTAPFDTQDGTRHYCLLHAPPALEPYGHEESDWKLDRRSEQQEELLKAVVNDWNTTNESRADQEKLALVLPGIRCGSIDFSPHRNARAVFSGMIDLTEAKIDGPVNFEEAIFSGGAQFSFAEFGEDSLFFKAKFSEDTWFLETEFRRDALFIDAEFGGSVWFGGAKFGGATQFSAAVFGRVAWFGGAQFSESAGFEGARFDGYARFGKSRDSSSQPIFSRQASLNGARFGKDALFNQVKFGGDAWFGGVEFGGIAQFHEAEFNKKAEFDEAEFGNFASFTNTCCFGDLDLDRCRFSGPVEVNRCRCFGTWNIHYLNLTFPAYVTGGVFHEIDYRTHTGARMYFNDCRAIDREEGVARYAATGEPLLGLLTKTGERDWTTADSVWRFTDQHAHLLTFRNMDLSRADFNGADLKDARLISCTWDENRGSPYKQPYFDKQHTEAAASGDKKKLESVQSTCRELRNVLEEARHYAQAGDFHYHEMEARRQLLRLRAKEKGKGQREWVQRMLLWLYWRTSDYGENYKKLLFAWMLGTIVVTAGIVTAIEPIRTPSGAFPWLHGSPIMWNFVGNGYKTVMGILPFATAKTVDLATLSPYSKAVISTEGLFLLILTTLFLMAINRRFRR